VYTVKNKCLTCGVKYYFQGSLIYLFHFQQCLPACAARRKRCVYKLTVFLPCCYGDSYGSVVRIVGVSVEDGGALCASAAGEGCVLLIAATEKPSSILLSILPSLIPFLERWREVEVKKLKSRVGGIIKAISERQTTQ